MPKTEENYLQITFTPDQSAPTTAKYVIKGIKEGENRLIPLVGTKSDLFPEKEGKLTICAVLLNRHGQPSSAIFLSHTVEKTAIGWRVRERHLLPGEKLKDYQAELTYQVLSNQSAEPDLAKIPDLPDN